MAVRPERYFERFSKYPVAAQAIVNQDAVLCKSGALSFDRRLPAAREVILAAIETKTDPSKRTP